MSRQRIEDWADIKAYLGTTRSLRTLRNWRKHRGLPVYGDGRSVHAYSDELDAWLAEQDRPVRPVADSPRPGTSRLGDAPSEVGELPGTAAERAEPARTHREEAAPSRRSQRLIALVSLVAVLGVGAGLLAWRSSFGRRLAKVVLEERTFHAFDAKGRTLWTKTFANMRSEEGLGDQPSHQTVDVDGDGELELLVNYLSRAPKTEHGWLACLETDGSQRWKFLYGQGLPIEDRPMEPFFGHSFFYSLTISGAPLILTVSRHATWYPSQLALLDPPTGSLLDEYWHPGYFYAHVLHDFDGDGQVELLLGGVNNPEKGLGNPALALFDLPFRTRASPIANENYFGPENAKEVEYFIFPQPDLYAARKVGAQVSHLSVLPDSSIQLALGRGHDEFLYYYLDSSFEVVDVRASDLYISGHDRLAHEGFLDHSFSTDELAELAHILRFPTAPDANSPAIQALFAGDPDP